MKIIFIRHGDPDYINDTLTEKGQREAKLLAKRVEKWNNITEIYCSPLGRAKKTASYSLEKLGRTAIEKEWLKEFYYPVVHLEDGALKVPWDFYPEHWTIHDEIFDKDKWIDNPLLSNPEIKGAYKEVCDGFDEILKAHGLVRDGKIYKSDGTHKDETIVFFCHLGVTLVLMGHLLQISPSLLLQDIFIAPTSVTVLGTEERREGIAVFRTQAVGDTAHLLMGGEPVSSSGYFTDAFQG